MDLILTTKFTIAKSYYVRAYVCAGMIKPSLSHIHKNFELQTLVLYGKDDLLVIISVTTVCMYNCQALP